MSRSSALGGIGRAFANLGFRRYFYGMAAMTTAFWSYRVALAWLVWDLTHSPTWLGLIVFVEIVPMLALGPVGGTVVDQQGALKIARIAQGMWAVVLTTLAVVTLGGFASKEVLLAIAFVQGAVNGFSNPAHLSLVAKLCPREDLSAAVALQSGIVQTGRFVGPAITGPLLALAGPGVVFALVAGAMAFATTMFCVIRTYEPERPGWGSRGFVGDFVDGVRYTFSHFAIRTILIYTAIMSILLRPVVELMPGFADVVFERGAEGLAWLMAGFGLGSVISAVHVAFRGETTGLTRVFIVNFAIGAASLLAFAFATDFWIAMALVVVFGMSTNTVSIASQTLAQHMVAGQMRARVMSLVGTTFRAVPAAGALVQGAAASQFGLAAPVIAASILCMVAWLRLTYVARNRGLARQAEAGTVMPT